MNRLCSARPANEAERRKRGELAGRPLKIRLRRKRGEGVKRLGPNVLLFAICCVGQSTSAADPPKPTELKVLEKFVGTWDCEVVVRPAVWTPKEVRETSVEVNEMALDGWFLQGSSKTRDGKTTAILMNTYDPVHKRYRIWRFRPGGSCEEMAAQWDEATTTLAITTDLGNGVTSKTAFHLIDRDHRDYHNIAKDGNGKVYLDIQGTVTRRK